MTSDRKTSCASCCSMARQFAEHVVMPEVQLKPIGLRLAARLVELSLGGVHARRLIDRAATGAA